MGADDVGDHAAPVDVADQHRGHRRRTGKAPVGDIALAQVEFGRTARALDHHQLGALAQAVKAVQHVGHEAALDRLILRAPGRAAHLPLHHDLRAGLALWLEQHRVHVGVGLEAAGPGLQRLRAPDFPAVAGDGSVVGHVLRLEGRDLQPAPGKGPAQPGRDQ